LKESNKLQYYFKKNIFKNNAQETLEHIQPHRKTKGEINAHKIKQREINYHKKGRKKNSLTHKQKKLGCFNI